jgi:hypothetical protein
VSSVCNQHDCNTWLTIPWYKGRDTSAQAASQSQVVERQRKTPCLVMMPSWRYNGKWSVNLLTITQANRPAAGRPVFQHVQR